MCQDTQEKHMCERNDCLLFLFTLNKLTYDIVVYVLEESKDLLPKCDWVFTFLNVL